MINLVYIMIFLIFPFLIFSILKSIKRGIDGKNRNKKD